MNGWLCDVPSDAAATGWGIIRIKLNSSVPDLTAVADVGTFDANEGRFAEGIWSLNQDASNVGVATGSFLAGFLLVSSV
jgi:hypothetical protein